MGVDGVLLSCKKVQIAEFIIIGRREGVVTESRIITCSKCGIKLRIPAGKNLIASCPKCRNSFRISLPLENENSLSFLDASLLEGNVKNSAPYIVVVQFWEKNGPYTEFSADWRCDQDALNTYFNVHSWYSASNRKYEGIGLGSGYTGFQNVNGGHLVLFSMWETDGLVPEVKYCIPGSRSEQFYGEGTGRKIYIPYDWKTGAWYTVRVRAQTEGQETYYSLYIAEKGKDEQMLAVIGFPKAGLVMPHNLSFLEDFTYNGLERGQSLCNFSAVTMSGLRVSPEQMYLYEYDSKRFRVKNRSLKCKWQKSPSGVISVRSSGQPLTGKCQFPAGI